MTKVRFSTTVWRNSFIACGALIFIVFLYEGLDSLRKWLIYIHDCWLFWLQGNTNHTSFVKDPFLLERVGIEPEKTMLLLNSLWKSCVFCRDDNDLSRARYSQVSIICRPFQEEALAKIFRVFKVILMPPLTPAFDPPYFHGFLWE